MTTSSYIQLGPYYNHNITLTRRIVARQRGRGAVTIYVGAPISAPILEVAIDGHSLYLLGFRRQGDACWWEFESEGNLPALSPSRPIVGGPASYQNLGLTADTEVVMQPWRLLTELSGFDGRIGNTAKERKLLLLLIFLVAEALRFDSVKAACYEYITNPTGYFSAPDHYHRRPADLSGHRFVFTERLVDTVQNWRTLTKARNPDIALPWIG